MQTSLLLSVAMLAVSMTAIAEPVRPDSSERDYVFVFIKTGPATDLSPEAQREAFAGHFSNMQRLAEAGELLIAGPLGEPKSDPAHRGLFIFDEATLPGGMAHAETDPTTKLGVFVLEGHLFTTDAPLVELPRLEKEDEARRLADPEVPDEWSGRSYVLATAPFDEALYEEAQSAEGVLIAGRLHGAGEEGGDQVLVWLDAEGVEAAKGLLPEAERWTLHGWYGSGAVAGMGR
tara:strand:+ start:20739 stop:21437 length:699 start_codon:yes stop_codon:yes gene_type:complete